MNTSINRTGTRFLSILILFVIIVFTSCRERRETVGGFFDPTKFDEDDFVAVLSKKYSKPIDSITWNKKKLDKDITEHQQYVYQANDYFPLWLDEDGNTKYVDELVKELENLRMDGLDPEEYSLSALKQQLKYFKDNKTPNLDTIIALDTVCTHAYLAAAHDLLFGKVSVKAADPIWYHANDTTWRPDTILIKQLYQQGKYPSLAAYRSKLPTYTALMEARAHYEVLTKNQQFISAKNTIAGDSAGARTDSISMFIIKTELPWVATTAGDSLSELQQMVKQYQEYYGMKATRKLDKETKAMLAAHPSEAFDRIDVNMERLRWLPQNFEQQYVLVNVPMMELFLRKDGQDVMHMNVVVGRPERMTPSLGADMANVVFNPSWGVPPTILKKDVVPGVAKSGAAYLAKKDLVAYDKKGRRVSADAVNASNAANFQFRQPPGDDNALGNIKFNLPNKWDIYLHDTPTKSDFGKSYRAKSSGCIRVEYPREMAEYILATLNGKAYDQQKIEEVIQTQSTKFVNLDKKLPVHIVYLTAFDSDKQRVRFISDIYKKDAKVLSLLKGQPVEEA
jgi:murein L,D-transpeptidase YcbB/YkuD